MREITVSMVACATKPETRDADLLAILREIKHGRWQKKQAAIRKEFFAVLEETGDREKAKKAVKTLKESLPGYLVAGTFSVRRNSAWLNPSGLLPADLDNLNEQLPVIRKKLRRSPHLFFDCESCTDGLRAFFRVPIGDKPNPEKYLACFLTVREHVLDLCGVEIDKACKDPARISFVSSDPGARFNLKATPIQLLPQEPTATPKTARTFHGDKPDKAIVREMLAVIPKRPDYSDWLTVLGAVGDTLPFDEAIEVLQEWSPEEREGEYAEKLRSGLNKIHTGTLFHLAKQHGWRSKPKSKPQPQPEQSDDETIKRLAAMSVLEYERVRKDEAEKLGCRESVLDRLVNAERLLANPANEALQGAAVTLPDVAPWPEPVNGAMVLEQIAERIKHYVVTPPGAAEAIALWCAHTHCHKSFPHSPRLNASSAEKQSGKTTLRDVSAEFVARPLLTENTTSAVLFRLVHAQSPTLLADEYDSWIKDNEELRGLLNAGHRRGAVVHRCEGEGFEVRGFVVFAPVMLCGIGALPGTLHDRSIVIRLIRAKRGEIPARFDSRHVEVENELCRKLARWILDNRAHIEAIEPVLPETMFNRVADNWRPLFAIAQIAGGDWPGRCVAAYGKLQGREFEDVETLRVALLTDIQQIFVGTWPPLDEGKEPLGVDRIFSKDLCEKLAEMKERFWPEVCKGKAINERWLARNLAAFGIRPKMMRIGDDAARGYEIDDLKDAFDRYVMPSIADLGGFQAQHRNNRRENVENHPQQTTNDVADKKSGFTRECSGAADKKGSKAEMNVCQPSLDPERDEPTGRL
jgi:hypothetical protein